ncbi:MAG: spore coat associated protein CotJA [Chitinophagales bacterium]
MDIKGHREEMELARVYIKIQQYNKKWSPMEGLQKGTIFPELYRPYEPRANGNGGRKGVRVFG